MITCIHCKQQTDGAEGYCRTCWTTQAQRISAAAAAVPTVKHRRRRGDRVRIALQSAVVVLGCIASALAWIALVIFWIIEAGKPYP